ncbi:MAG TPA: ATP-binding protein [Verrucomicrobiae bacterium]|nr:ATP-binding protein [Verrucomicrobiae bacterium]
MITRSIRFRLVAWYAGLLTGVFLLLGALMYSNLKHFLESDLAQSQARRARQIADTLLARVSQTGAAYVAAEVKDLYEPEVNDRFIRITRSDGSVVYVSQPPKDHSFDPTGLASLSAWPAKESFRKQLLPGNETLLVAAVPYRTPDGKSYVVEVGAPLDPVETMLDRLFLQLALGLPITVLVVIVGGYLLVGRALAPVDRIARKAEQITQHNLSERLPVAHTADELERLSLSLNLMIARLEDAFLNSKRFVADASHELRTPLTAMRAELETVASDSRLKPELRESFGSMLEEVERLTRIVEQLLTLSRLDAGEAQADWARFDLADLAVTTAEQMSLLAEDKGIKVSSDVKQGIMVEGDRARLKQVVVNLLDNAIKYTPEKGAVHLRVANQNGHAILEVFDNGIGIPEDALPHVFDRFFRVDKARTRDPGGAGLGLSIVKSICTAHGATVEAHSYRGGSSFRVTLPITRARKPQ